MLPDAATSELAEALGADSSTSVQLVSAHPVQRIRAEFLEMPGLKLTLSQAAKVFGLDARQSKRLLDRLIGEGFLVCDARGAYRRP